MHLVIQYASSKRIHMFYKLQYNKQGKSCSRPDDQWVAAGWIMCRGLTVYHRKSLICRCRIHIAKNLIRRRTNRITYTFFFKRFHPRVAEKIFYSISGISFLYSQFIGASHQIFISTFKHIEKSCMKKQAFFQVIQVGKAGKLRVMRFRMAKSNLKLAVLEPFL